VDVLDLVDQRVAERHLGPDPLDAARLEAHARRLQHPDRVRDDGPAEQAEEGRGEQEASPPAPAPSGSPAPTLAARLKAGERIRSTRRVSRLRRIAHAGTSALTGTVRH